MHKRPSLMKSACLLLALASLTFAAPLSKAQDPVSFQLEKGGRANLPGGTWIEAKAPCSLSVMMDGETIKEITVTPVDVSSRTIEFTTNKAINTPNYRITTIWDDSKGEETFIVRMKAPSAKPSVTFEVKDGPITSDEEFFTEVPFTRLWVMALLSMSMATTSADCAILWVMNDCPKLAALVMIEKLSR